MKRVLCILLTLVMVLTISTTCFAAGDDNSDKDNNNDEIRTVDTETYDEEKTIKDEDIPEGSSTASPGTIEIEDQSVPQGLPSTGGIPAEAFYVAGALFIVAALVLSLKKTKTN